MVPRWGLVAALVLVGCLACIAWPQAPPRGTPKLFDDKAARELTGPAGVRTGADSRIEEVKSWLAASTGVCVLLAAVVIASALARHTAEARRLAAEAQQRFEVQQAAARFATVADRLSSPDPVVRAGAASEMVALAAEHTHLVAPLLRQLGAGVLMEPDADVRQAEVAALREAAVATPEATAALYTLNLQAKQRLVARLAQRAAVVGARSTAGLSRFDAFWDAAAAAAGYPAHTLRSLLREPDFDALLLRVAHQLEQRPGGDERMGLAEIATAAAGLRASADLLAFALSCRPATGIELRQAWLADTAIACGKSDLSGADFSGAYLQGIDMQRCVAKGASFRGTRLDLANLTAADLRAADFEGSVLDGARLGGALLKGAKLWGFTAQPMFDREPKPPNFDGADWWEADVTPPPEYHGTRWDDWLQRNFPRPGTGPASPTLAQSGETIVVRMPHQPGREAETGSA